MIVALGLAAAFAGCGVSVEEKPRQEEATWIVLSTFGASPEFVPPVVLWRDEPWELSCGRRAAGAYWITGPAVVWWQGSYSTSAFAHELLHAWHFLAFGVEDPDHVLEHWKTLVPKANEALAAEGL